MKNKELVRLYRVDTENQRATLDTAGKVALNDIDFKQSIRDRGLIAIQGDPSKKKFVLDNRVIKVTERWNEVPVKGIDEQTGDTVDLIGKFIKAYYALKELWLAIKRLF
jgi:hypothetical protein